MGSQINWQPGQLGVTGAGATAGGTGQLIQPNTAAQAQQAQNQVQGGLSQQQALANALSAAGGIQNQQASYGNLGNLAAQYGNIAAGQGPNPATALLAQQTGANAAQTAASQAGQRGASQNVGLLARQAGQQGANLQQQAVGQAATTQANQSLAALGQQGNLYAQQAGIAQNQVGNQQAALQAYNQNLQGNQGQILSGIQGQNQVNAGILGSQNATEAALQQANQSSTNNLIGNLAGAGSKAITALAAQGGLVQNYDDGGAVTTAGPGGVTTAGPKSSFGKALNGFSGGLGNGNNQNNNPYAPGMAVGDALGAGLKSLFGPSTTSLATGDVGNLNALNGQNTSQLGQQTAANAPATNPMDALTGQGTTPVTGPQTAGNVTQPFAKGGKVPAMVSPQEKIITPGNVKKVANGEKSALEAGKTVPGKAKVPGNSLKNDTVKKDLAEGSIVLPRSVTQSKNPGPAAQKFVEALLKKSKNKKPN